MSESEIKRYLAGIGSKGGKAGTGRKKIRGGSDYYKRISKLAADARKNRASWADIATALGTSPEQAELQYSPRSPVRDTREPCDPD